MLEITIRKFQDLKEELKVENKWKAVYTLLLNVAVSNCLCFSISNGLGLIDYRSIVLEEKYRCRLSNIFLSKTSSLGARVVLPQLKWSAGSKVIALHPMQFPAGVPARPYSCPGGAGVCS